ncbi:hypothetical protein ACWEWD_15085 [Streptomyces tendae]
MTRRKRIQAGGLRSPEPVRPSAVPDRRTHRDTDGRHEPAWPDATQVWNWTQSVTLSGYGPAASSFL